MSYLICYQYWYRANKKKRHFCKKIFFVERVMVTVSVATRAAPLATIGFRLKYLQVTMVTEDPGVFHTDIIIEECGGVDNALF